MPDDCATTRRDRFLRTDYSQLAAVPTSVIVGAPLALAAGA
jgi:hypothetical protein